ncbi:MAG: putative ABC transporter permease [Oscillospiraceae bacterium]|nr:putative ABC transporter permease [Oscillospiraceae bacterium]
MFFENIDLIGLSPYQMCMLFLIWAFLGWGMEVCVHALKMGEYSNRGFLSMPICPIYGFGVLIIMTVLRPVLDVPVALFFLSSLICTSFELAVGVAMKKLFHSMWWDYSDEHFNFHGYICLKVSIEWGVACLIAMTFVMPVTQAIIALIPQTVGVVIIIISAVLIAIDTVNSVAAANRITLRLKEIAEISAQMYEHSQDLGGALAGAALDTAEKGTQLVTAVQTSAGEAADVAAGLADNIGTDIAENLSDASRRLRMRYDAIVAFTADKREVRMLKAFPTMHPDDNEDVFKLIKSVIKGEKKIEDIIRL